MRSTLGLTVEQTDFIGTMINLGSWMGILGGLVYDRFGPKPTGEVGRCRCCGHSPVAEVMALGRGQGAWTHWRGRAPNLTLG